MSDRITPDWIAIDWGTSNLRGWAMQGRAVLDKVQSGDGMGRLGPSEFEAALTRLVQEWEVDPDTPIIACGMVGSRQGWREAPYRVVPCTPLAADLVPVPSAAFDMRILPGLRQSTPPDVMRGEETQIAGFLSLNPNWDGVICLPGTHCKWAQVSAGEVVSFQTFMTGELFAFLAKTSVLRHSVDADHGDDGAFDAALAEALSKPEGMAARLFQIRANDLLNGSGATVNYGQLTGTLLGAELAAARPYWLGTEIAIIGEGTLAALYGRALKNQGAIATQADVERMTLAGLTAAYRLRKESV